VNDAHDPSTPSHVMERGREVVRDLMAKGDRATLRLGRDAADVVTWLVEEGLVEVVDTLTGSEFLLRLSRSDRRTS